MSERDSRLRVREAHAADFDSVWPIFHEVVAAGDTYSYDPDTTREEAFAHWMEKPRQTFVVEDGGQILGTYYIKTNHDGGGRHVCNCGFMVSAAARGRGLAKLMCEHAQAVAIELDYQAMQFNFVVASNTGAVRLWQKLSFEIVGTLPKAFNHPEIGYVDAYVMYKWLSER
jgi:L-amino acid N-acyltransferase YncA